MAKVGDRVQMLDGSLEGVITEIKGPYFWSILWDDGQAGAVHPLDVKLMVQPAG